MILRTSGLTYYTCATPARTYLHMCTHTHTHLHSHCLPIPLHTLTLYMFAHTHTHTCLHASAHIYSRTFAHKPETDSLEHTCVLTHRLAQAVCMWVSILYSGVCAQLYFPGWGSKASPGTSWSTAFSKSPTWWTLGVSANPSSKPERPWDQSTALGSTQAGWQ